MSDVYINRISKFLPNNPVSNDEMEDYLGLINGKKSKSKNIVLRNNGIEGRYYALDKKGNVTHTNTEMTALAVKELFKNNPDEIKEVDLLSGGTTSPDQLLPAHTVMVHGLLPEMGNIEVTTNAGSCCSGMHAFKYAYMSVKSGEKKKAVAAGSDRFSSMMKSELFDDEAKKLESLELNPYVAFEKDFLRWMLSDGAGALLIEDKKNENGLSLRIDWIELFSYANEKETCMYMGGEKNEKGEIESYMHKSYDEIGQESILSIKQDVKLLSSNIVELGFDKLNVLFEKRGLKIEEIDHFLPHISSYFFQDKIYQILEKNGLTIPYEKWFTNLKTKGNVGSGSIYLMLEELFNERDLKKGEKIFLAVPESARFSYAMCLLTVC